MNEKYKWVVSTLLAVLAVAVPVVIYVISTAEKTMSFKVISKAELLNGAFDGLEIKMGEKEVKSASVFLLSLENSGSIPIRQNDFERAIYIEFDGEIYSAKIKEKKPSNLTIDYEIDQGTVKINPFLFNADEYIELEVMSSSEKAPEIDSRIAGLSLKKEIYENGSDFIEKILNGVASFLFLVFYARCGQLSFVTNGCLSKKITRGSNLLLSITCALAGYYLFDKAFDNDGYLFLVAVTSIPIGIGIFISYKELEYNKQSQEAQ